MARLVLHIHDLGLGGAERVTLDWLRWLQQAGHEVWMLLGPAAHDRFFTPPDGIQVLEPQPSRGLSQLPTAIWLRRCLQRIRPDCVIGITTRPALNLLLASVGRPWPVLVAERNYPPAKPLPLAWGILRRWLYPRAALHLVQTERIGSWLTQQGLARQLAHVPNAVHWPLAEQSPFLDPSAWVPPGASLLLGVGTKPEQKGFDRLLLAFSRLAESAPDWWLALPGVPAEDPCLQQMLAAIPGSAPWRQRLLLTGRTGNLSDWYARADLFVLSSRYEGFPNVLLEAMAAGTACLALDCPTGPRELIEHRLNGWLVEAAAEEAVQQRTFEQALKTLMGDASLRARLGQAAMAVRERFAVARVRQQLLAAVDSCLEPRVLVFAPTRRSQTETFVRANLARMPLPQIAYFGDEFGFGPGLPLRRRPGQWAYGCAVLFSKISTRLGWQKLSTVLPSLVAWGLVRVHQPDVLLAEFGFHAVRMMDAARWSGLPLVVHFRGSDASADRRLRPLAERYRYLMALAQGFIVKSRPMREVLLGFGASPDRITISPSGADGNLFVDAAPAVAPPTVLFVGRLVEKKGPLDALEAFARARQCSVEQARLIVVGDGPLRAALVARVEALRLQEHVQLLGLQPPERIAQLMQQSRCLLLPSRVASDGDAEGCPVALLEAQVAGLPVVSTRHAGIPEVVQDGTTALLAEEGDVEALAAALVRLLSNPDLAGRMGRSASAFARERFTVQQHTRAVSDVLKRVVILQRRGVVRREGREETQL